jgi:hypothetical protein
MTDDQPIDCIGSDYELAVLHCGRRLSWRSRDEMRHPGALDDASAQVTTARVSSTATLFTSGISGGGTLSITRR